MRYADHFCTYTEDLEYYTFTGPCVVTGKQYSVKVPKDGLYAYRQGAYIQDAFPKISEDDREFLMTGYSPEGWRITFPPEEQAQCAYCGGNCPYSLDGNDVCDGFSGDIDGLYDLL